MILTKISIFFLHRSSPFASHRTAWQPKSLYSTSYFYLVPSFCRPSNVCHHDDSQVLSYQVIKSTPSIPTIALTICADKCCQKAF